LLRLFSFREEQPSCDCVNLIIDLPNPPLKNVGVWIININISQAVQQLSFVLISGQIHSVKYVVFGRSLDSLTRLIDRSNDCLFYTFSLDSCQPFLVL
jgi:hypothetical protein